MHKTILSSVATMVLLASGGRQAWAGHYAAFVLHNPTGATIRYEVKWGNGSWKKYQILPGRKRTQYYPLAGNGFAPNVSLRVLRVSPYGLATYKTYQMNFYYVNDAWNGKHYSFSSSSNLYPWQNSGRPIVY